MKLTLPYPPSANRYWRKRTMPGKTGAAAVVVYRTPVAKAYVAGVERLVRERAPDPYPGDVCIAVDVFRPRKSGDLSNRFKVLEDALRGVAIVDDSYTVEIVMRRWEDADFPRVQAEVLMATEREQPPRWLLSDKESAIFAACVREMEALHERDAKSAKKRAAKRKPPAIPGLVSAHTPAGGRR